jgi:peptidoglycan/LPS O-acetylase OafA/YrhL
MLGSIVREALLALLGAVVGIILAILVYGLFLGGPGLADGDYALVPLVLLPFTAFAQVLGGMLLAILRPRVSALAQRPVIGTLLGALLFGLVTSLILNPGDEFADLLLTIWFVLPGFLISGALSGWLQARRLRPVRP